MQYFLSKLKTHHPFITSCEEVNNMCNQELGRLSGDFEGTIEFTGTECKAKLTSCPHYPNHMTRVDYTIAKCAAKQSQSCPASWKKELECPEFSKDFGRLADSKSAGIRLS